jgi:hypothetical protein
MQELWSLLGMPILEGAEAAAALVAPLLQLLGPAAAYVRRHEGEEQGQKAWSALGCQTLLQIVPSEALQCRSSCATKLPLYTRTNVRFVTPCTLGSSTNDGAAHPCMVLT